MRRNAGVDVRLRWGEAPVRGSPTEKLAVNLAAFDNLKRVLRTVPDSKLRMDRWDGCAIGHASRDPWFQQRGLERNFTSATRLFGIRYRDALSLFSIRAGRTPDEVLAAIDRFLESGETNPVEARARRQVVIDGYKPH